jgi:hypothetical protein
MGASSASVKAPITFEAREPCSLKFLAIANQPSLKSATRSRFSSKVSFVKRSSLILLAIAFRIGDFSIYVGFPWNETSLQGLDSRGGAANAAKQFRF